MGISASNPKSVDQPAQPRFGRMDVGLDRMYAGHYASEGLAARAATSGGLLVR